MVLRVRQAMAVDVSMMTEKILEPSLCDSDHVFIHSWLTI